MKSRPAIPILCALLGVLSGLAMSQAGESNSASLHWAYRPPQLGRIPPVQDTSWPRGAIDRFILAQIEARGLRPAADADRATLCRRLCFDLTGLPPTPEEIDAFVTDARPDAVVHLVDRLLASPRFGEHWARHWFDIVRFAESVTLRGFIFKQAWRYRDYVIDAFNRDVPLDQFIREQIAGDLLSADTLAARRRQLVAITFLMLGNTNLEEQDKKQLEMDFVDEQLDVIGKAFLGQTIACARCHDHKFDPIPTRDYYALAGILKNAIALKHDNVSAWTEVPLPLEPELEAEHRRREIVMAGLEAEIKAGKLTTSSGRASANPLPVIQPSELPGIVVDSAQARRVGEWKHSQHTKPFIGDGYLHDDNSDKGEKTLTFQPELPRAGRYEVRFAYTPGDNRATRAPVTIFHAEGETLVHVNERAPPPLEDRFVPLGVFRFEASGFAHVLVSNEAAPGYVVADAVQFLPADRPGGKATIGVDSTAAQGAAAAPATDRLKALEARLKELRASGSARPMVMAPRESTNIIDAAIHRRGSVHSQGEVIPRGFLSVAAIPAASAPGPASSGRRELAEWITRPENPLTARVLVNRVWLWLMGEGLVRTPDNFGATGETPTHPELLDWLAAHFAGLDLGSTIRPWSLKSLVREIVLSRAYQLGSLPTAHAQAADPDNRLLSHAVRRRLSAEQLRDAMLAISGRLRLEPPVGPTFPAELAADYSFVFHEPRRSVYAPVFRNAMPEMLAAFDAASPSTVTGRRDQSTVAPQALFLLNHPFVRDQAQAAAERFVSEMPDQRDGVRLDRAFKRSLGRLPTDAERVVIERHLGSGATGKAAALDQWAEVFHALFGSLDFIYLR